MTGNIIVFQLRKLVFSLLIYYGKKERNGEREREEERETERQKERERNRDRERKREW